jgi:hypothetical protein
LRLTESEPDLMSGFLSLRGIGTDIRIRVGANQENC